jgi:hypothetical protein
VATNITIAFTSGGLASATSSTIVVSAAAAEHLTIQTQPSASVDRGLAFAQQPKVRLEDAFGNLLSTDNSTVVTASRSGGSGTLQGTLTPRHSMALPALPICHIWWPIRSRSA